MPWFTPRTGLAIGLDDALSELLVLQANFAMASSDAHELTILLAQVRADLAAEEARVAELQQDVVDLANSNATLQADLATAAADLADETSRAFLLGARIREAEILINRTEDDLDHGARIVPIAGHVARHGVTRGGAQGGFIGPPSWGAT